MNESRREEITASLALDLEIPESWLSKHSPEYCESQFCEKEQICLSRDVLLRSLFAYHVLQSYALNLLLTNKFKQHFNNKSKNRQQLVYDLLS